MCSNGGGAPHQNTGFVDGSRNYCLLLLIKSSEEVAGGGAGQSRTVWVAMWMCLWTHIYPQQAAFYGANTEKEKPRVPEEEAQGYTIAQSREV